MPKKQDPELHKIDWAEFVEARRQAEWNRQHNRPSQMIERHACKEWDSGPAAYLPPPRAASRAGIKLFPSTA